MKLTPSKLTSFFRDQKAPAWGLSGMACLFIAGAVYGQIRFVNLTNRLDQLSSDLTILTAHIASTTGELQSTIEETRTHLSGALSDQEEDVSTIRTQLRRYRNEVGDLSGNVTTLQKLAETDPELLKKYSKVYFLNENYVPARLSEIPFAYQYSETKQLLIHTDILPRLEKMIDAASSTGVTMYVASAYRSFDEQRALKGNYTVTYGAGTANSFSADQGYSEHQLGTAVDLIAPGQGGALEGFDATPAYTWLQKHAHEYGFTLSYPKKNGYYVYEPWHWRFVGVKLATDLHEQGKGLYDLDQRDIDEYLVNIFD